MRTQRSSTSSLVLLILLVMLAALLSGGLANDSVSRNQIEPAAQRIDRILREQEGQISRAQKRVLEIDYALKSAVKHRAARATLKKSEPESE